MKRLLLKTEQRDGSVVSRQIDVSTQIAEMTFRSWVDYFLLLEDQPAEVMEFLKGNATADSLSDEHWVAYLILLVKIVNIFTDASLDELIHVPLGNMDNYTAGTIAAIASEITGSIASYEPTERSDFTHKGHRYVLPVIGIEKYGDFEVPDYTKDLTVAQVIESFQRGHIYNMTDHEGNKLKDRRFQTDLAVVASLARRVDKNGKKETPPLGLSEYSNFVSQRMTVLADLPATTAIDVCFFLTSSQIRFLEMLTQLAISSL